MQKSLNSLNQGSDSTSAFLERKLEKMICLRMIATSLLLVTGAGAAELKVDLNPSDNRKDLLTPHWENWAWR
jgi:hypothetical protein